MKTARFLADIEEVLLDLEGKDALLPGNARFRPRADSLEYRLDHLRNC